MVFIAIIMIKVLLIIENLLEYEEKYEGGTNVLMGGPRIFKMRGGGHPPIFDNPIR